MAIVHEAPNVKTEKSGVRPSPQTDETPRVGKKVGADVTAGFLVFLIALPLCLGIAKASAFPPITGVFTAIIGGILASIFSNSELTIKGPAAGMIAIVAGAMLDPHWLGHAPLLTEAGFLETYRFVLAVGVISGVIQVVLGLAKAGVLTEFFPMAPVHGLLASIGFIIISKQSHVMLGHAVDGKASPLQAYIALKDVPFSADYKILTIGVTSLTILFSYPWLKARIKPLRYLPAQLIVLLVAIPLGYAFHLDQKQLVELPDRISDAVVLPDFSQSLTATSFKWVLMFCLVGSLESLLSAKAIDILDPWKRKTNMNRDMLGVGIANTASAAIGGLPMISEILRSSANIGNGGRTRLSNVFHGLFLLLAIVFIGSAMERIPLAALGAMLVFAGFRLASPKEFAHMWHLGFEQFLVFVVTVACIVPNGNLLMVGVGMALELIINFVNGGSIRSLFKPTWTLTASERSDKLQISDSLTFTNWIPLKRRLEKCDAESVTVDLTSTRLIDHTVMDKLVQSQREFTAAGRSLSIVGLDRHRAFGHEATSGRKLASVGA